MGWGSFDLSGNYASPVLPATPIGVFEYDGGSGLSPLPNVYCLRIDAREGPEPPVARFEYRMSQIMEAAQGWPSQFEELWPLDAQGDYVVQSDDRLVVGALNPDGSLQYLFDGLAQVPQADVTGKTQRVSFVAVGIACTASFDVIHSRIQRDTDNPGDTSGDSNREVPLPCRFNPQGTRGNGTQGILPNSTPDALYTVSDEDEDPIGYPVFVEPLLQEREITLDDIGGLVVEWYIADALLYLVNRPNPGDPFIAWPDSQDIIDLLETYVPGPDGTIDPSEDKTANVKIRDYDATGKPLPRVLADLLGYAGFRYAWSLDADGDGAPQTSMNIFRTDGAAAGPVKSLYLMPYGTTGPVDPTQNNVTHLNLARDSAQIVNAYRVETRPRQIELTVMLSPLFQPDAGDATPSASPTGGWNQYKSSNLNRQDATSAKRRKYRWYGADECSDGHWNAVQTEWVTDQALDLTPVFPDDEDTGERTYAVRYRPGGDRLFSLDDAGRPRKATLEVSFGGQMDDPIVVEPGGEGSSGTWYAITKGWQLLDDRLGFEVTIEDPEQWHTGNPDPTAAVIRGITWLAKPTDSASKQIQFRLTTVIDDDQLLDAEAGKRVASPTGYTRERQVDAKDHFAYQSVAPGSLYYDGNGTDPDVIRDDTEDATTHAEQLRAAREMPETAGSVTIPYITTYYEVGDRIDQIAGRDVPLQTNILASQGEAPTYPWVTGVSWSFDGDRQTTTLQLSDRRGELATQNAW